MNPALSSLKLTKLAILALLAALTVALVITIATETVFSLELTVSDLQGNYIGIPDESVSFEADRTDGKVENADLSRLFLRTVLQEPQLEPTIVEAPVAQEEPALEMDLIGVAIFGERKMAILQDRGAATPTIIAKGDLVGDWKLTSIERNAVVLQRESERFELLLADEMSAEKNTEKTTPAAVSADLIQQDHRDAEAVTIGQFK